LGIPFLNALVVTGFRAHRHWARPQADRIFVACDAARTDLIAHGIVPERIFVVGTPIRSDVRPLGPHDKARLRATLGLRDAPVVVVSSGATGAYRSFDALIKTLAQIDQPIDIVTFKGSPQLPRQLGGARILRLGFREDFCEWLSASDLVVGKLGGLTAAEACA